MNRRNRPRRALLVLALFVLAAIVTGVAASATKTAIPKQLTGRWELGNGKELMVVGPRGKVNVNKTGFGWYHVKFSHVTAHRLSISGPRSCSGTGRYRWNFSGNLSGGPSPITIGKIHDACRLRVGLFANGPYGWSRP